jgi:hypothetical protein
MNVVRGVAGRGRLLGVDEWREDNQQNEKQPAHAAV